MSFPIPNDSIRYSITLVVEEASLNELRRQA
jgi:hypothetical protein